MDVEARVKPSNYKEKHWRRRNCQLMGGHKYLIKSGPNRAVRSFHKAYNAAYEQDTLIF